MSVQAIQRGVAPGRSIPLHTADVLWTLVRTDFKTRYHGTLGGFVWALLKPLAMFIVLFSVFSFVFVAEPSYRLYLVLGLFLYEFFTESTRTGVLALSSKAFLLRKAKFPSWIIVLTSLANALITLTIFTIVLLTVLAASGRAPSPLHVALYLFYLALFVVIVLGISLGASVLFLRYRDLNQVWDVIIQAGMFLAPVVYPLRVIPLRIHFYLYLWPPTPIIQFSRSVLIDGTIPTFRAHVMLIVMAATIFGLGLTIYRRFAPSAAEYL